MEPKDGSWGVTVINESWDGIVGELQRHEADFSLNLTPTSERLKVISFTVVYTYDGLVILSLKSEPLSQQLALTRPFTGRRHTPIGNIGGRYQVFFFFFFRFFAVP